MDSKKLKREENPFEDPEIAKLWSLSVEGEKDSFRDKYIYPLVSEWLADPAIHEVVDVGAGQGAAAFLAKDKKYIGIEPSQALVERAKEIQGDNYKFKIGNAYDLPLDDNSVDAAFSINVWFHLKNPEIADRELARVLKPNGKFLIVSANPDAYPVWESFFDDAEKVDGKIVGKVQVPLATLPKNIIYTHSDKKLIEAFTSAGLVIDDANIFAPDEKTGLPIFKYYLGRVSK